MKAKAERRCARCQKVYMAMLQNRLSHHSDVSIKYRGHCMRCKKSTFCIAAICVAAMWCTKIRCGFSSCYLTVCVVFAVPRNTGVGNLLAWETG